MGVNVSFVKLETLVIILTELSCAKFKECKIFRISVSTATDLTGTSLALYLIFRKGQDCSSLETIF